MKITILQKIKAIFESYGPKTGSSLSCVEAESDRRPQPPRPVEFSIEPDEPPSPEPDGDGFVLQPDGSRVRKILHGGTGSGMFCDEDEPRPRRRVISLNDPFKDPKWRR